MKDPMRSTKVNLKYYNDKCKAIFGDEYLPNVPETNLLMGATTMSVTNIVFTNGGEDPWKWASILKD
jgi:hypothetical protein